MIITKLERQKKKERFNVHLDGEYAFAIDADTLLNFRGLRVGNEIDESEVLAIQKEGEKRSAYARAFSYVSRGMHTLKEVRDKLKKLAYTDDAVTYAVDRLAGLNLVNDRAYAVAYVETHHGRGKLRLTHELKAKGVDRKVIDEVLACVLEEEMEIEEATTLAIKFYHSLGDKTKVQRRLLTRGYSYSVIERAVSAAIKDGDDEF